MPLALLAALLIHRVKTVLSLVAQPVSQVLFSVLQQAPASHASVTILNALNAIRQTAFFVLQGTLQMPPTCSAPVAQLFQVLA